MTCIVFQSERLQGSSILIPRRPPYNTLHRPTWVACIGIKVSRSSQSGLPHSSNPAWKLHIIMCARNISRHLQLLPPSSPGHRQPLLPRHLRPHRKGGYLLYRATLKGAPMSPAEAFNYRPMYPNKNRGGPMVAVLLVLRWSISLVESAGDDDQVPETADAGMQVSKDVFTQRRGVY